MNLWLDGCHSQTPDVFVGPLLSDFFHLGIWCVMPASSARRPAEATAVSSIVPGNRYFFYTPEMSLLAESALGTSGTPAIQYEYVWFGGEPVAQIDGGTTVHWTFADHLGTPWVQTDAAGVQYWRAEYEPYGRVFSLSTADQHQPLRLPGQEAEQLNLGANGVSERSYNVFRWYRPSWGRYAEPDPLGLDAARRLSSVPANALSADPQANPYLYAAARPLYLIDPYGLIPCTTCDECPSGKWTFNGGVLSAGLGYGRSRTKGTFTCLDGNFSTAMKLPVTIECEFGGPIVAVGAGVTGSTPFASGACGCNSRDLLGTSTGFTGSFLIFSVDVGRCGPTGGSTVNAGVGLSVGAGFAHTTCTTRPRS
ncbi:MAG: RHS repeat-associated core domain-containing protein [Acidobacteriota bacterium]